MSKISFLHRKYYLKDEERDPKFSLDYENRHEGRNLFEIYHENSKTTRVDTNSSIDPFWIEIKHKSRISGKDSVTLPEPQEVEKNLSEALQIRESVRNYSSDHKISSQELSSILGNAVGVREKNKINARRNEKNEVVEEDIHLRKYASAGGTYPVNIYFYDNRGDALYFYYPEEHVIKERKTEGSFEDCLLENTKEKFGFQNASGFFILTMEPWRISSKYEERGYRYAMIEAGEICQNIQLVSKSLELDSIIIGAFYDKEIEDFMRIDGVEETVVQMIPIGEKQ